MRSFSSNARFVASVMVAAALTFAASPLATVASQSSWAADVSAVDHASNDLQTRLGTLKSFDGNAAGIDVWTKDTLTKANFFHDMAKLMTKQMGVEVANMHLNNGCKEAQASFFGPYDSSFGFDVLSRVYGWRTSELKAAIDQFTADENKLLQRMADNTLHGRTDPKLDAVLRSTRAALATLVPLYNTMDAERSYIRNIRDLDAQNVYGLVCGAKDPTPKPSAAPPSPSPSPKPSAFVRSKSGCVGFNGYWGTQQGSIVIKGAIGTLDIVPQGSTESFKHTTTFTGMINGNVMSGSWSDPKLGKGTFVFTLHADGDSMDATITNSSGTSGKITPPCERGL
jgi:hypothetical protein